MAQQVNLGKKEPQGRVNRKHGPCTKPKKSGCLNTENSNKGEHKIFTKKGLAKFTPAELQHFWSDALSEFKLTQLINRPTC